ncbi:hypothetical protein OG339_36920 [Streptosporangium sp. NBC_01495]|nr:hypothetical protein [Streptosporangium sp. NBC_01495]
MRNAIRALLGLTMAVLALFGSLGTGESRKPVDSAVSSVSTR